MSILATAGRVIDEIRGIRLDQGVKPGLQRTITADGDPPVYPRQPAQPVGPQDLASGQSLLTKLRRQREEVVEAIRRLPPLKLAGGALSLAGGVDIVARKQQDVSNLLDGKELGGGNFAPVRDELFRRREALLDAIGQLEIRVTALEAEQIQRQYDSTHAAELRKLDQAVARALLAFRDAWQARVAAADGIRLPAGTWKRPQLAVRHDINGLVQELRACTVQDLVK